MNYIDAQRGLNIGERSFLFYLCDALRAAPQKVQTLLKIAAREDYETTKAYTQIIHHLMTIAPSDIVLEEKSFAPHYGSKWKEKQCSSSSDI